MYDVANGWLWMVMDVVGAIVLAGALIYGTLRWRNRDRGMQQTRDEATRQVYRQEEASRQGSGPGR